jgi:succinate dehydrogenase / fumarate reductase cytochrome b subunit
MAQGNPQSSVSAAVRPVNPRPARQWPWPLNLYQTAVGKKWVMAVTGVMGMGFLFVHMLGNLKLYLGATAVNNYAEGLRTFGEPFAPYSTVLDALRAVLALAIVVHIHAAFTLWRMNRRAQPVGYQSKRDYIAASWASRTMKWTGPIVVLFIAFHLLDLTWGVTNPNFIAGDVYHNVVVSFERVPVAALYVVANLALGVHLFHGAWSLFQSLGVNSPRYNRARRVFAFLFTLAIIGPNVSFPLAVQLGIVR